MLRKKHFYLFPIEFETKFTTWHSVEKGGGKNNNAYGVEAHFFSRKMLRKISYPSRWLSVKKRYYCIIIQYIGTWYINQAYVLSYVT
jgi:hypothetical protein